MFASLLFINHYEYTRDATFVREKTWPLLSGLLDWWSCYLVKQPSQHAPDGYVYVDSPDQSNEGENTANPQIGLAMIQRLVLAVVDMAPAVGAQVPAAATDIMKHLVPFNTGECLYTSATGSRINYTLWHAVPNETSSSNMFAMYPVWPTEALPFADPASQTVAQATARAVGQFANGRPVEIFPAAVRAGLGATDISYTPTEIMDGLDDYLHGHILTNLIAHTPGGGIENVGVTRAINEMLAVAPGGKYIAVFPVWNMSEPAAFTDLWVKGGYSISAKCGVDGVQSPMVVKSRLGAGPNCTVVHPWPGRQISVTRVGVVNTSVPTTAQITPLGNAVTFAVGTAPATFVIELAGATATGPGCTAFTSNCTQCIASRDGRGPPWGGSPCVYLSGPSEGGARCQPSRWWFPPYNSAVKYPSVHACKACTNPTSSCPVLPGPPSPPPPPAPPGTWQCVA